MMTTPPRKTLLRVNGLKTHFFTEDGVVPAVDGISFELARGETVGIVGESGSGKSVTALSIMRLISPPGRIVEGSIYLRDENLVPLSQTDMASLRGNDIAMIFQEPTTSLNPVYTIGAQIREAVQTHAAMSDVEARHEAIEALRMVGIPEPQQRYDAYPHELSGGMRQRVMIAMGLVLRPALLIADEPTTALDVTIQAQILELMRDLRYTSGTAMILITHDLGVVAEMVDKVVVMYAGQIVENADVYRLFKDPKHPYTQGLLASIPTLTSDKNTELPVVHGTVPNLLRLPRGCRFHPRCTHAMDICRQEQPVLKQVAPEHNASCWLYE